MYILLPSGSVEEPVRYLRITHKFRDETQATKSAKVLDAKKPTMVGIRHAKGGTATKVLRKNGNSKKTPETTKEKDNTSNSGILSDIVTTNKENRSEGSTYNAASSGIDSAEGGVKRRGGLFLMKKTIKVIPRAQTVWRGDTTSNSISRIHKQLLPILQKQKSTDNSYYNNGNNDEEENKNSDDDDDNGEKNSHEEDNIENYETDDNNNDDDNKQQRNAKQRGIVELDGSRTYSGRKGQAGSKSSSGFSFKKARLVGMDEIHANRMVSSTTCNQEEVSESITMSTAIMNKDAYVEWRNAQGQMVSFSTVERSIRKYACDTLFSKVNFITLDSQLEYTGKCVRHCNHGCLPSYSSNLFIFLISACRSGTKCIAHVVCQSIGLEKSKWDLFRDTVREEIRIRRTNANTAIRKEYMGKSEEGENIWLESKKNFVCTVNR